MRAFSFWNPNLWIFPLALGTPLAGDNGITQKENGIASKLSARGLHPRSTDYHNNMPESFTRVPGYRYGIALMECLCENTLKVCLQISP